MDNQKTLLSTRIFIAISLTAFILFAGFYFFIIVVLNSKVRASVEQPTLQTSRQADRYFLNENYDEGNTMITKRPTLKDMLVGPIITANDPIIGDLNAPMVIVEFSDFKCDYCAEQELAIKQSINEFGDKVAFIWKDYPENNIESESFQAAIAARCAQAQNSFWQYHDLLFSAKESFTSTLFMNLANRLDLDAEEFKQCFLNEETAYLVKDNMIEADALGIMGIPFIYVNDREILGATDKNELKKLITEGLNN